MNPSLRTKTAMFVVLVMLVTACGGASPSTSDPPSPSATPKRPSSTGRIKIVSPQPAESVLTTTFKVRVKVTGAQVLEKASTDLRPDTGHVHMVLDGKTITLLAGLEYELKDLTPGQHLLQAEFAAADHGPFNPRVIDTVTFSVQ